MKRALWDTIKWTNIHLIEVPEGKEREQGAESLFKEITFENLPNLGKEVDI